MDDRLPMRSDRAATPARPGRSQSPARPAGPGPVHAAGSLNFTESVGTREEVWQRLGPKIQERVNSRIGRIVEWWATDVSGRNSAAVLGTDAFVTVEPTVNASGNPAHEIRTLRLVESTFRRAAVNAPAQPPAPPREHRTATGPGTPVTPQATAFDASLSGFLGNLPPRAQQLLQEPFVDDPAGLWHDFYYFREGSARKLGGATLKVWCYLANRRYVTFAAGTGHGYHQDSGPRSWELTCWRAEVAGGTP